MFFGVVVRRIRLVLGDRAGNDKQSGKKQMKKIGKKNTFQPITTLYEKSLAMTDLSKKNLRDV